MATSSIEHTTKDHEEIRNWVESHAVSPPSDSRDLAFLYQARMASGEDSPFCKLINPTGA